MDSAGVSPRTDFRRLLEFAARLSFSIGDVFAGNVSSSFRGSHAHADRFHPLTVGVKPTEGDRAMRLPHMPTSLPAPLPSQESVLTVSVASSRDQDRRVIRETGPGRPGLTSRRVCERLPRDSLRRGLGTARASPLSWRQEQIPGAPGPGSHRWARGLDGQPAGHSLWVGGLAASLMP